MQNSSGKMAMDILNETPLLRNTYDEMKRILRKLVSNSLFLTNIPKLMDMIMVMMVLIATMAFQDAVSPPGGVWQEDNSTNSTNATNNNNTGLQRPGEAVMASTHPTMYSTFVWFNTSAFVSAFVTIILIVTGLPSLHFLFLLMVMHVIGMAIAGITLSYFISVFATSTSDRKALVDTLSSLGSIIVFFFIILIISRGTKSQRQAPDLTHDP